MGGAYIAVANDTASMFYNPAGIARITGGEVMAEYGDILTQDPETLGSFYGTHFGEPVKAKKEMKFVGGVYGAEYGEDSGFQIGLSYAPKLYSMPSQIWGSVGNFGGGVFESIKFETEVEQLALGIAGNFGNFAVGVTLDYQTYTSTIIYTEAGREFGDDGRPGECEANTICPNVGGKLSEFSALGGTLGLLYRNEFGENNLSSFSIGAVYRNYEDAAGTRDAEVDDSTSQALAFKSPVAPTSWGVGAAVDFPVFESFQLLLTAQYEVQDYGDVTDDYVESDNSNVITEIRASEWNRTSAGAELNFLADNGAQWFIRGGYYTAEDSNYADERFEYSDVSALTAGVGVYIPSFGKIDVTIEKRDITNNGEDFFIENSETPRTAGLGTYDPTLISVSYSYVWF